MKYTIKTINAVQYRELYNGYMWLKTEQPLYRSRLISYGPDVRGIRVRLLEEFRDSLFPKPYRPSLDIMQHYIKQVTGTLSADVNPPRRKGKNRSSLLWLIIGIIPKIFVKFLHPLCCSNDFTQVLKMPKIYVCL